MGLFDKLRGKKSGEMLTKSALSTTSGDSNSKENASISDEVMSQFVENMRFYICSGFYSDEEILSHAETVIEELNFGKLNAEALTRQAIAKLRTAVTTYDNFTRLARVFDILNRERIIAVHFAGWDLDEGFEEVGKVFAFMKENNIPRRGYCFYHKQDIDRAIDPNIQNLQLAFHSMNDDKKIALEVGERIVTLLQETGFDVDWNHTISTRIKISNFLWDKVYNGEDYGAQRAIQVMGAAMASVAQGGA
jgi:hypothetical protein